MGKACLRFRRLEDLDLDLVAEAIASTSVADYLELYARALGKRVVRILSVSESGAYVPPPMPYAADAIVATGSRVAKTEIDPGTQEVRANVSMSFELQ